MLPSFIIALKHRFNVVKMNKNILNLFVKVYVIHNSLEQGFPNWGTCTPRDTFRLLKGYIIM